MGYFNYFIKCIIRKFVNLLFKPKFLLSFLIVISLLFVLQITSRAEWTDDDKTALADQLEDIRVALIEQLNDLEDINKNTSSISEDVVVLRRTLTSIDSGIYDVIQTLRTTNSSLDEISSQLSTLLTDIDNLNTSINNVYNKLDENQKELLTELEADNQAVLEELNMIRESINGTEEHLDTFVDNGVIESDVYNGNQYLKSISLNYQPKYTYKIKVYYRQSDSASFAARVWATDNVVPQKFHYDDYASNFEYMGTVPVGTGEYVFTYNVPSSNPKYIYFRVGFRVEKIEVYRSIKGIVESLNDSNSLQQEQNQLQQESNQLQQEQNDFLKDDNVNTDGLEFATDDTVNPTSDGFDTLFNTIYNAFCNTSSEPLTITLPFINKTFTIQPNIVSNGMQKAGLGVIVTLINSFYYFSVCLFIYKDIGKIIDNLKSGNITSDCGNVKTEVL